MNSNKLVYDQDPYIKLDKFIYFLKLPVKIINNFMLLIHKFLLVTAMLLIPT